MDFKHPFRVIFYAPSYSGKTTQITKLLKDKDFSKQFKKNIFIFTPTSFSDKSYKDLVKEENIFEEYDEEIIEEIMEESKKIIKENKGKKKHPILFVLDDAITDIKRNGILNKIFTKGRHYDISIIVSSQQAKLCSPCMRLNCSHMVMFPQKLNDMELQTIAELLPIEKDLFYDMVKDIRNSEPYSFLKVDLSSEDLGRMFSKNGEKFYKIKDE
jgi:hypothetical protein